MCIFACVCVSVPQDAGNALTETLRMLEGQCLTDISALLSGESPVEEELGDLFFDCVDTELKFYQ